MTGSRSSAELHARNEANAASRARLADVRKSADEPRLLWNDRLSVDAGRWFINRRQILHGSIVDRIVPAYPSGVSETSARMTPPAFEATASSKSTWSHLVDLEISFQLNDFKVVEQSTPTLSQLGLPEKFGLNPMLCAPYAGKQLYVAALTLLQVVAIPSPRLLDQLSHPLNMAIILRHRKEDDVHEVRPVGRHLNGASVGASELMCCAYWLEDNRYQRLSDMIHRFVHAAEPLRAPHAPGIFKLRVSGYETEETIVVQKIRSSPTAAYWPGSWRCLQYVRRRAGPVLTLARATDGKILRFA